MGRVGRCGTCHGALPPGAEPAREGLAWAFDSSLEPLRCAAGSEATVRIHHGWERLTLPPGFPTLAVIQPGLGGTLRLQGKPINLRLPSAVALFVQAPAAGTVAMLRTPDDAGGINVLLEEVQVLGAGAAIVRAPVTPPVDANQLTHLAITGDTNAVHLHVNGELRASVSLDQVPWFTHAGLLPVVHGGPTAVGALVGFQRCLSPPEIRALAAVPAWDPADLCRRVDGAQAARARREWFATMARQLFGEWSARGIWSAEPHAWACEVSGNETEMVLDAPEDMEGPILVRDAPALRRLVIRGARRAATFLTVRTHNTQAFHLELPDLESVPALRLVGGGYLGELALLSLTAPRLTTIQHDLSVNGAGQLETLALPALAHLHTLNIQHSNALRTLDLGALRAVENLTLTAVSHLAHVTEVLETATHHGIHACGALPAAAFARFRPRGPAPRYAAVDWHSRSKASSDSDWCEDSGTASFEYLDGDDVARMAGVVASSSGYRVHRFTHRVVASPEGNLMRRDDVLARLAPAPPPPAPTPQVPQPADVPVGNAVRRMTFRRPV
jgi:hypothetical protein